MGRKGTSCPLGKDWGLSIPDIILGQGLCDVNVKSELDWVPLKAALDGSSHKTAGQGREHEKMERKEYM